MRETLDFVEGRMDEGEFYGSLIKNAFKSIAYVIGILISGLGIYHIIIPSISDGSAGLFLVSWVVTLAAFLYVFRTPTTWFGFGIDNPVGRIPYVIYSGIYSGMMYLGGETIVIAMVLLGIVITVALLVGDIAFTGVFTYNDLKEWVRKEQTRISVKENGEDGE